VQSPAAKQFGITKLIPTWVVPQPDSEAILQRTFLHRDWLAPILLLIAGMIISRVSWFTGAMWQAAYNPSDPPAGLVWEARRRLERLSKVLAGSRRGHSEDPG